MGWSFERGLDKALEIIEAEWQKHSDACEQLLDKPEASDEFYRHLAVCRALNDVIARVSDEYERLAV